MKKAFHHTKTKLKYFAKHAIRHKVWNYIVALLIALILIEVAVLFAAKITDKDLASYADLVLKRCSKASYAPTCYEEEIPKLMSEISMEDAFKVTSIIQGKDTTYKYCHVLGHKLSARETAEDPSLWKMVIQRCPSGVCSNGCIHGAFQERFRRESVTEAELEVLKPQFADVCENRPGFSPTGLEQASCYHALGHLFMYVTDADIDRSLELCEEMAIKGQRDYSQLCYDGAFMQIFQPLEPDDFSLIEGKEVGKSQFKAFCGAYTGKEKSSCWSEGWPLFREELSNPQFPVAHCSVLDTAVERERCFSSLLYVYTAQAAFDKDDIASYCESMPMAYRGNCFAQASSRILETDYRNGAQSAELCAAAGKNDPDGLCYKELVKYSSYNFHPGSNEFYAFCETLPENWKSECLKGAPRPVSKSVAE